MEEEEVKKEEEGIKVASKLFANRALGEFQFSSGCAKQTSSGARLLSSESV